MRYLYSANEAKEIDRHAIHEMGMPGLVLMEKAAMTVAAVLMGREINHAIYSESGAKSSLYEKGSDIRILAVCGTGNNGGDGVAAARILHEQGYHAAIAVVGQSEHMTEDMKRQLEIAVNCEVPVLSVDAIQRENFDVILDGLFGVGLSRNIEGVYADVIEKINQCDATVYALDVPSGVHAGTGEVLGTAIRADCTITFGVHKLGLLMYPGCEYAGEVIVGDIGFPKASQMSVNPTHYYYEKYDLLRLVPARKRRSNKGNYGKILVVAGCETMAGAAVLAAKAAYAVGAGLVKVVSTENNRDILLGQVPEALFCSREEVLKMISSNEPLNKFSHNEAENHLTDCLERSGWEDIEKWADAIVVGPGLGLIEDAEKLLRYILDNAKVPTVIDGDGLRLCRNVTDTLLENFILTPHVKEMSVLTGHSVLDIQNDMIGITREAAGKMNCVIANKDARTVVSDGMECYINVSGNNGMATGGSGDVLAGVLAGLLGQGMTPFEAAKLAVYWHGISGDIMVAEKGPYSLVASDLIEGLWKSLNDIKTGYSEENYGTI